MLRERDQRIRREKRKKKKRLKNLVTPDSHRIPSKKLLFSFDSYFTLDLIFGKLLWYEYKGLRNVRTEGGEIPQAMFRIRHGFFKRTLNICEVAEWHFDLETTWNNNTYVTLVTSGGNLSAKRKEKPRTTKWRWQIQANTRQRRK